MVELKVEVESVVGHEICCDASGPRDPLTVRVIFNKAECSFFFPFLFFPFLSFFHFSFPARGCGVGPRRKPVL